MIEVREQANPFTKAKIVAFDTSPADYAKAWSVLDDVFDADSSGKMERGDKRFVMSRSQLMEFNHCPRRWINGFVSKESSATKYGTLMDCLFTQPELFDKRFAIEPETYTNPKGDPKPWTYQANSCKEWREAIIHDGLTPVSPEDVTEAKAAIAVLRADETVAALADESDKQVFVLAEYHDEATDLTIPVKALIDLVPPVDGPFGKTLIDFKTAASAAPGPWKRAVYEHNYHVQAALYLDAYCAATGEDRVDWFFIISENYRPWEPGKRFLSSEFLNLGRELYVAALEKYCKCLKTGQWHGYDGEPTRISYRGFNICEPDAFMLMK